MRRSPRAAIARSRALICATLLTATAACDRLLPNRGDNELPPIAEVRRIYEANGVLAGSIEYDGNVVVIRVRQPPQQLQRGGSLWAKVGPYIYVFNPASQQVLETYPGIAGVRAITRGPGGREVARATLPSANLNPILWRRALNLLGHAVNSGTERPSTIEALVRWGEQYTQFRYNPEFVPEAAGRSPGEDDP